MNLQHPSIDRAFRWLEKDRGDVPFQEDYCETRDVFQARLDRMRREMEKLPEL